MGNESSRPVLFGEVLFDRFPDGSRVLGGAPFNVAWHLRGLGLDPLLVSRVGEDDEGREILDAMQSWGLDTAAMQKDPGHRTGAVEVSLSGGEPTFDILPGRAWDHVDVDRLPDPSIGALLYHGTLAAREPVSRHALDALIASGLPRFVDVNLRPPFWSSPDVLSILSGARWVKLNENELDELAAPEPHLERAAAALQARCGAELLLVTRGRRGAWARDADGEHAKIAPRSDREVVDTVGAGDGFAAVTILGLLAGWRLPAILARAQEFAGDIVGLKGATTTDDRFYRRHRKLWSKG